MRSTTWRSLLLIFAIWTTYGLVRGTLSALALPDSSRRLLPMLGVALGAAWFWALLTPAVMWLARRWGPPRIPWGAAIAVHLPIAAGLALVSTGLWRALYRLLAEPPRRPFPAAFFSTVDVYLASYIAIVSAAFAVDAYRRYRDRTARTLALETQLSHAHLHYLQRQLQPHFLFNCLNAIAELAHEGAAVAERMLHQLRSLLATALGVAQRDRVTVREEMEALAPYLELQRTRFGGTLTVEEQVSDGAWEALVPNLVLQPLVENAIQHGLRSGRGRVDIDVRALGSRLQLRVSDNGVGMGHQRPSGGIGLRNTLDRLQQLYGTDFRFALSDRAGGGAVAELDIPLRTRPAERVVTGAADTTAEPAFESAVPATSARAAGRLSVRLLFQLLVVWAAIGMFWMWQVFFLYQALNQPQTPLGAGKTELASAGIWAVLTPLVLLLARRVPITRGSWRLGAPVHVVGGVLVAAAHVLALHGTGLLTVPIRSGVSANVFSLNLIFYFAMVAWSHTNEFAGWYRERELTGVRLQSAIARAQWQAVCVELRPAFVLGTLDFIARCVRSDVARAERLIDRLAAVLRITLETAGESVTPIERELDLLDAYVSIRREMGQLIDMRATVDGDLGRCRAPNRLLRTVVDQLLARSPDAAGPVEITVEAARQGEQATLRVRTTLDWPSQEPVEEAVLP